MRPFLRLSLLLSAAAVTTLSACFSDGPVDTGPQGEVGAVVDMTPQVTFSPARVEIRAGQAVRWRNTSSFSHTATADPALARDAANVRLPSGAATFDSGDIGGGQEYTHTFTVAGEYKYFCIPHEQIGMVGTVVVLP